MLKAIEHELMMAVAVQQVHSERFHFGGRVLKSFDCASAIPDCGNS